MFVAKYPAWITQIEHPNGKIVMFDGIKDMLSYYFEPKKYGGQSDTSLASIFVKDYYTLQWINGRKAVFVIGSDVTGPMGHEFIAFATLDAAQQFFSDHNGEKILTFDQITVELVRSLR